MYHLKFLLCTLLVNVLVEAVPQYDDDFYKSPYGGDSFYQDVQDPYDSWYKPSVKPKHKSDDWNYEATSAAPAPAAAASEYGDDYNKANGPSKKQQNSYQDSTSYQSSHTAGDKDKGEITSFGSGYGKVDGVLSKLNSEPKSFIGGSPGNRDSGGTGIIGPGQGVPQPPPGEIRDESAHSNSSVGTSTDKTEPDISASKSKKTKNEDLAEKPSKAKITTTDKEQHKTKKTKPSNGQKPASRPATKEPNKPKGADDADKNEPEHQTPQKSDDKNHKSKGHHPFGFLKKAEKTIEKDFKHLFKGK